MHHTKWKVNDYLQWNWLALGLSLAAMQSTVGQSGRLVDDSVLSRFLGANLGIHVYLPPSYDKEPTRRYPVLYLHDGQNVFSSAGMNIAFGWGNWGLDKTMDQLCHDGKMQEIIMVAVDNSPARYEEYCGRPNRTHSGESTNVAATNTYLYRL